ncbi:MAG: chromosome segregation protein SMC [Acidimicrobiales bacterium]|nr:MAG: chromosome segregation protein SMC [Acidimicrobiales bacterium]
MYLSSLTLKGFKSFASATTFRFEPGITCVVGPNGSGKSNVVDAIAWVLGEQGAKTLRGGKMDDVIFAGTAGRPPLGRAEVTLTIDNSDAALPIDYTEISITRRLFRSGDSEYEINGNSCRLLDVQELLSDSGIGREMHVIVGQGQLDSVLQARPEDRRGFIEEAAGVLKHRKRKEKALRKLDAMQANLNRVNDLTAELRRQLKPLGRQAEVARRAAGIQADLRDSRLRLLADDLLALRTELDKEVADEASVRSRRDEYEQQLNQGRTQEAALEQQLAAQAPTLARAQETWYLLSALAERFRGTTQLAAERVRFATSEQLETRSSRDPDALNREAHAVREQYTELCAALDADRERLSEAVQRRTDAEQCADQAEKTLVARVRAAADRREGLAKLAGRVSALRSRTQAASDEIDRLLLALADARQRAQAAEAEFDRLQNDVHGLDEGELDLDARHVAASAAMESTRARVAELTEQLHTADRGVSESTARAEALELSLTRKDAAGALLAAGDRLGGVLGSVAAVLSVEPGTEAAIAAALGELANGVAVSSAAQALAALELLKADDAGRTHVLIGSSPEAPALQPRRQELPLGARWAVEVVQAPSAVGPAVAQLLHDVVLTSDLAAARRVVAEVTGVRAVTLDGDVLGLTHAAGGSASAPSVIEVQATLEAAISARRRAIDRAAELQTQLDAAEKDVSVAAGVAQSTLSALHESDAAMNAVAQRLAELGSAARSASLEAQRLTAAHSSAEQARAAELVSLEELEYQLAQSESIDTVDVDGADVAEPSTAARDEAQAVARVARQNEMEVRLAVRTSEERARALLGRAQSLERAAATELAARQRAQAAAVARARGAVVARAVARAGEAALEYLKQSLLLAADARNELQQSRVSAESQLIEVRGEARELSAEVARLTDAAHRDEVARTQQRARIERLEGKAADDFGIDVETLLTDYSPKAVVPPTPAEIAEAESRNEPAPPPLPYHRPSQEKRAARAERELALLGKVNPLALEEFAALEERHAFLATQLDDLKVTRRNLLTVISEVDERIHDVFATAFEDTAREFEVVFGTLFPGGEGRLVLTEPDDMLTTGVEVQARPAGKKVKRLSLLSGGERSLTAVALLVAIFRARPSPFYLLDEVEAALDDTNLGRLLTLISQLRETSQLIMITHQKRSMEIADALYGVSMRGDGITQVVGQRLREVERAG